MRNTLGGWQFGGVWILQTGLPFTVYTSAAFHGTCGTAATPVACTEGQAFTVNTGGDYNADGTNYDIPNVPSFGRHLTGQNKADFLKGIFGAPAGGTAAAKFPTPTLGAEGNLGRNTYDASGYNNLDFTFEKFFGVPWFFGEKMKIEAKGEVFNLFNRSNLWTMSGDLSTGNFGQATNQLPGRSFQLHLRASF
jgi:hypothetical protein